MSSSYVRRQNSACDRCHTRKTKCDRMSPCAHCTAARVECLRTRARASSVSHHRVYQEAMKRKDDELERVLKRVARLEDSLRGKEMDQSGQERDTDPTASGDDNIPSTMPAEQPDVSTPAAPEKRDKEGFRASNQSEGSVASVEATPAPPPYAPAEASRDDIPKEPPMIDYLDPVFDLCRYLGPDVPPNFQIDMVKQDLLRAALKNVKQLSESRTVSLNINRKPREELNLYDPSMHPNLGLSCLIFSELKQSAATFSMELNAHITTARLERMAMALIEGDVHGQSRLQCMICVNTMAYCYLSKLSSEQTRSPLWQALAKTKDGYLDNVLVALKHLKPHKAQSLSLVQALLSAALLMQDLGHMRRCWQFNMAAGRVCIVLSNPEFSTIMTSDDASEASLAFIKCFILDRALTANIYQPSILAPVTLNPDALDTTKPSHSLLRILLDFAMLQDEMLHDHQRIFVSLSSEIDVGKLSGMKERMLNIRTKISNFRSRTADCEQEVIVFEWAAIDFISDSMMATVIRVYSRGDDQESYQECLDYSRSALSYLHRMIDFVSSASGGTEKYTSSFASFIPLFLLRPLLIMFRHVVLTSDMIDFKRILDVSKDLKTLGDNLPSLKMSESLASSLVKLYLDFVNGAVAAPQNLGGRKDVLPGTLRPPVQATTPTPSLPQYIDLDISDGVLLELSGGDVLWEDNSNAEINGYPPLQTCPAVFDISGLDDVSMQEELSPTWRDLFTS